MTGGIVHFSPQVFLWCNFSSQGCDARCNRDWICPIEKYSGYSELLLKEGTKGSFWHKQWINWSCKRNLLKRRIVTTEPISDGVLSHGLEKQLLWEHEPIYIPNNEVKAMR